MDKEIIETQKNSIEEVQKVQEVQGEYEEVEIKQKEVRTDSYFDGGLLELIGWRILGFLITVVTLGIGAPWAQCMLYSWQYKHTVYNGKRLKFEGTGGDLFVHGFKWLFFTIITLGLYLIVLPVRKTRWVISNIHFEDEPFVKDESYFDGKTIQLIGVNLLCNFLTVISLGLFFPFTVCYKIKWLSKHTIINRKRIAFTGKTLSLFGKYILWVFLTIITFGIYGLWLPIKMLKWQTKHTHIKRVGEVEERDESILIPISIVILFVLVVGPSISLILRGIRNSKVVKGIENSVTQVINSSSDNIKSEDTTSSGKKTVIYRTKSSFNPSGTTVKKKTTTTKKKNSSSSQNKTADGSGIAYDTGVYNSTASK